MIRLAEERDLDRIGQLWQEMVEFHAQFDPSTFRPAENGATMYSHSIQDRLSDPLSRVLVAEEEGEVVAYISGMIADITTAMFMPLRSGLLADIYVEPEYRRRSLARQLVERLSLWFHTQDVAYFEWHVSAKNEAALAFWESIGGELTILRMRAPVLEDDS